MKRIAAISLVAFASLLPPGWGSYRAWAADFQVGERTFLMDGRPYVVKAAELHYPRIPRPYWRHRIRMAKALGMNTICLYVFWNAHETQEGRFDFTGQKDLRRFVELCRDEGMNVILRPGPYVCAEWEMGGLPWWLLNKEGIRLRSSDPRFLEAVGRFELEVASQLRGLTAPEGGPIIMVQVENELGSFSQDKPYVSAIRDMLRAFYPGVTLFQCDWASNFQLNGLDDLVWTMNFGTGADVDAQFAPLRAVRPDSPLMCSEYWSGWFDKWGANHETRPAAEMTAGIEEMLGKGISFSLYMTHGGTNFGHWAGANSPGFAPDVTSYDYDAPIDESGRPTPKFHELRKVMEAHSGGVTLPDIPESPAKLIEVEGAEGKLAAPLEEMLGFETTDSEPRNMEAYGQGYGWVAYTTTLESNGGAPVEIRLQPKDYAQVFLDGKLVGVLDRRLGQESLSLPPFAGERELTVFVEAMGRINFGTAINDRKGMAGFNVIGAERMGDWEILTLPTDSPLRGGGTNGDGNVLAQFAPESGRLPRGLYEVVLEVDEPGDTFLDFSGWGKGMVWLNGEPLGRIWEIGPQQTLYAPGCWMREGENLVQVLDVIGPRHPVVSGLAEPRLDKLQDFGFGKVETERVRPQVEGLRPWMVVDFDSSERGWRKNRGAKGRGRRLVLEAVPAVSEPAALAELWLVDGNGRRLSRERWRAGYVSDADSERNRTADKLFDLQESTYWQATEGSPALLEIDLGGRVEVSGVELLPRVEPGEPGRPAKVRLWLLE